MTEANLVFPHQLFEDSPLLASASVFYLVEERLFFRLFRFHKQKLAFHRSSMKFYEGYLKGLGKTVHYVPSYEADADLREFMSGLTQSGITKINYIDPTESLLEECLLQSAGKWGIRLQRHQSPMFLNARLENADFFHPAKRKFFQTAFYKEERKKRRILMNADMTPAGGKWSYDRDNRKKYPPRRTPPAVQQPRKTKRDAEAVEYVKRHFPDNPGELGEGPLYPTDFSGSKSWFHQFLDDRFHDFGTYEDAIVANEHVLHHSVLSPLLNSGLLTPSYVLQTALDHAARHSVPLNSTEGFVRQIVGWREFMRGMYEGLGSRERSLNFWGFSRKMPAAFYRAQTDMPPVDITIGKVLRTGYCHHIERLMILGNFMLLCEIHPDEVYRWFMEHFIDACDWAMVPNVYGMSQYADGGLMTTKPYISGSNYIMKQSDYRKGDWQGVWDALFWRFLYTRRNVLLQNPRLAMLERTFQKMSPGRREEMINRAESYLKSL